MADAADAAVPAAPAGYSLRDAAEDLVGGAFRPRRPPGRLWPSSLGWGRQAALVAVAGFVQGIDVYLREPFTASDLPPALVGWLPALNILGNPAISILVSLASWLLMVGGGRTIAFRRFTARHLGSGLAFGWWSATLPTLAAIVIGLILGLKSDTIAFVIAFLVTLHLVPSVAESCDLSVGHAFWVIVLGPLAAILAVVVSLLGFGFAEKLIGFRLLP